MSPIWTIVAMALGMYALRLAGFLLADLPLPAAPERALRFVPLAVLTALCVSTLSDREGINPARLVAAVGATLVMAITGRAWACILGGLALYWLLGWSSGIR